MLLHTHNEQKNRCTYNRCCMMNVAVMQRRFLFAAQVFVDDTQPILAAHWVYCRKMFLQPQQRLCLSHVIANHCLATAATPLSFACHCEPPPCNRRNPTVFCMSLRTGGLLCRHLAPFCMSLRTSAHTGVAIRSPCSSTKRKVALQANSQQHGRPCPAGQNPLVNCSNLVYTLSHQKFPLTGK